MAKKKKNRPKGLIQIIAAIGLVMAILWTAKGLFQFGSASYKEVNNKLSKKITNLPTLRCVTSDNSYTIIYDLAEMDANEPKNVPKEIVAKKKFFQQDGYFEIVDITDNEYQINIHDVLNGVKKGYLATITRSSGDIEWVYPDAYNADLSFSEISTVMQNADRDYGVCSKVEKGVFKKNE